MAQLNLICLPFAGGNSYSYNGLKPHLNKSIRMITPELPGRGTRIREALCKNLLQLVDEIYNQISDHLNESYVIYGHSMGGSLGNLLIHRIIKENKKLPLHFLVTGHGGPQIEKTDDTIRHLLNDEEFKKELIKLGGSPKEILEQEELLDFFTPILKADFQAIETYEYNLTEKHNIPITNIVGDEEDITPEEQEGWKLETTANVELHKYPGNHFFIFDEYERLSDIIHSAFKMYDYS